MKSHYFHAFVCLIFIFSIIFVGMGLCLVPTNPMLSYQFSELLLNSPKLILNIGKSLIVVGGFLLLFFYFIGRKSYYHVEIEPTLSSSINEKIIHKSISELIEEMVPQQKVPFTLNIYGQNIEIIADLSRVSFERHEDFLDGLEPKLSELMAKTYGQPKKLKLSIASLKA